MMENRETSGGASWDKLPAWGPREAVSVVILGRLIHPVGRPCEPEGSDMSLRHASRRVGVWCRGVMGRDEGEGRLSPWDPSATNHRGGALKHHD
jgi:hypothetical protein